MADKILLMGGIGYSGQFIGGEDAKNMHLLFALRNCGRKVIPVNLQNLHYHPYRILKALIALLVHRRANVIVSSSLKRGGWLIKLFHFCRSNRIICFVGTGCQFPETIASGAFSPRYFSRVSNIVVQGGEMQNILKSVGLDSILLPNFKRIDKLPTIDLAKRVDGQVRFVFLSRIHHLKGVDLILDCVETLNRQGMKDSFTVDFFGPLKDSDYKTSFDNRISPLDNVRFCGLLDMMDEYSYSILSEYTAMLFPTFWPGEGFPGVIIDSLIAGLPMIASDWHFNKNYVEDGVTGVIIPSQNTDALASAMVDVINNRQKYLNMASDCQKYAMKYDCRNVIDEAFLRKISM